MKVVVVESPAKAKTINKYLGKDYEVLASFGHIRDLPPKDGSVEPDADFAMKWEIEAKAAKRVSDIAAAVKGADRLILATDPDREGEAISWHIVEALRARRVLKDVPIERVTFNAITKDAVPKAWRSRARSTRRWSTPISPAARWTISSASASRPCCGASCRAPAPPAACSPWRCGWSATASARSRPSSPREYWSIVAHLATQDGAEFEARLVGADGKKISRLDVGTAEEAEAFRKRARDAARLRVASVEAKPAKRHPAPPFTTSTLQQEASRKLGMAPARTMQVAQRLYEGVDIGGETVGLITYMRTDGVDMAPEAIASAPQGHRQGIRRPLRPRRAAQIRDQAEERPGGARGRPPDRHGPPPRAGRAAPSSPSRRGSTS